MIYLDSSKSIIRQPYTTQSNGVPKVVWDSATEGGYPRNLQYDGKSLRKVIYMPRGSLLCKPNGTPTSSTNWGNLSMNGTSQYVSPASRGVAVPRKNFTQTNFNGGYNDLQLYSYSGNANIIPSGLRYVGSSSKTFYLSATFVAKYSSSQYMPLLTIFKFTPNGNVGVATSPRECHPIADTGYIAYSATIDITMNKNEVITCMPTLNDQATWTGQEIYDLQMGVCV